MAIKSGFFNSVNGDRLYKADFFAEYFASFIANGVFPDPATGFQVVTNGDMSVNLRPGKAWINGYFITNDADYNLQLDVADGVLNRIDRIVLQLNYLNREIIPVVKKGTFASNPVVPSLKRDADAYEIALADVYVGKGVLSISQANITDLRMNSELCGIVAGVVNQIDTTGLFAQYDSEFSTWFESIQDILDGDVAGNLANQIAALEQTVNAHLADYVQHPAFAVTTGSANAYEVALNPAPTAYEDGFGIVVAIHADSTGASTLNVNGLGAIPIKKSNGNDVTNLKANGVYTLRYSAGNFILQGEGGYGNAQPGDVLSGKTFTNDAGEQTGTMPNRGIFNLPLGASVPAGYYSGGTVPNGKKNAQGMTAYQFDNDYYIEIRGLDFQPSYVVAYDDNLRVSDHAVGVVFLGGVKAGVRRYHNNYQHATFLTYADGFKLGVNTGSSKYRWFAYE